MDFTNQDKIFNPEKAKSNIFIAGVGSVGSFVALTLSKMGFTEIKAVDFDKVEEKNIPNQFYRMKDINEEKIIALQQIIKEFTNTEIGILYEKIGKDFDFSFLDLESIVIMAVDTMEARKIIYEKIKEMPIVLIDIRMGGEGYQIYSVSLNSEEEKEKFEKTLTKETLDTPCGQKSIIYTILSIASEVCNIVKKIDREEDFPYVLKREMKTYRFIEGNGK